MSVTKIRENQNGKTKMKLHCPVHGITIDDPEQFEDFMKAHDKESD